MANKYSLHNIPIGNRSVFFDANILIYIFWPSGNYYWENNYSSAFAKLLRGKIEMCVDFIVISEVVNRTLRLEYEKHILANVIAKKNLTFKQFRDSFEGQSALQDIYLIIETNILTTFKIIGKQFLKSDIRSLLTLDTLDFADKAIVLLCKENSLVLITNDADYKMADIDLLSANPKILKP